MKRSYFFTIGLLLSLFLFGIFSCTQEPMIEIEAPRISMDSIVTVLDTADLSNCDTTAVTYSSSILPLLVDHCQRCHSGENALGGVRLDSYEGTKRVADQGRLYGAVSWQGAYENMPQGEAQLPVCDILNIRVWVDGGALNN